MRATTTAVVAAGLLLVGGCYDGLSKDSDAAQGGTDTEAGSGVDSMGTGGGDTAGDSDGAPQLPDNADEIGISGMRRLTANEYDNTLRDILLDDASNSELLLPEDPRNPFDNDYTQQVASQALIEGADLLAQDAVERLLADAPRRDMVVGCTPSSPGDEACMTEFVRRFGKLALRRTLTDEDVELFLHGENGNDGALDHAQEDGDFYTGVDTFLHTILQDPEFLYRVEVGVGVEGDANVFKLTGNEVATRLSYFIWGSTPDEWLIDSAESGGLDDTVDISAVAEMMLADPRAIDRVDRFHALWLGYETMSFGGDLAISMRGETKALIERVVFEENRPWHDLFRMNETFVDAELAEHYGLPAPGAAGGDWVQVPSERAGLLGQGAFLSVGGKFGDTSPVQRGVFIRTRLLCQDIPPPPPEVDADQEPEGGICKEERYAIHSSGGCAACHSLIDPVGFGLESYDAQGRFREFEPDDPDTPDDESTCAISGEGEIVGVGTFSGPGELGQLALDAGLLDECVATQLYRYAMGRYDLDELDEAFIDHLVESAAADGEFAFGDLVGEFVSNEAFTFRREE